MNSIDLKILKYISEKKKVRYNDLLKRFNHHSRDVLDIRINNIFEYVSNYYDNNINDDIIEINNKYFNNNCCVVSNKPLEMVRFDF